MCLLNAQLENLCQEIFLIFFFFPPAEKLFLRQLYVLSHIPENVSKGLLGDGMRFSIVSSEFSSLQIQSVALSFVAQTFQIVALGKIHSRPSSVPQKNSSTWGREKRVSQTFQKTSIVSQTMKILGLRTIKYFRTKCIFKSQ